MTRAVLLLSFGLPFAAAAEAPETATGTLTVVVTGMKADTGSLMLSLASSERSYEGEDDDMGREGPVEAGRSTMVFDDLPFGEYAIKVYHDKNGNGEFDTGLFGLPKERYGFSNDARARFGPAKWDDAKFTLDQAELTVTIKLR